MESDFQELAGKTLSIIIKAYNEEAKISRAIESALAARPEVSPMRLEVVVADSCSSDGTVRIASGYPVRVVQFLHAEDRGCGAGVELGFQASRGDFVYLMDGDMALQEGFLRTALGRLMADPALAGVGGAVIDERIGNDVDRIRVNNRAVTSSGVARSLGGGGLFRRDAIERAGGYAAHQGLKGYEEADLAMRLRAAGFQLWRLDQPAVTHLGHHASTWQLLARHWRTRRAMSSGVLLRAAFGQPWLHDALWLNRHAVATLFWWLTLLGLIALWPVGWAVALWSGVSGLVTLMLAFIKRDVRHASISVLSWHYAAAALILGLLQAPVNPRRVIPQKTLHEADAL